MRVFIFCLLSSLVLGLSLGTLQAQEAGRVRFSIAPERTQYLDRVVQSYGLDLEIYLSDYVSMSYRFAFGRTRDNGLYAHIPMGTWFAAYPFTIYVNTTDDFYLYATLISVALPESLNFHIPLNDNFHLSPYIAPLGMYYEEVDPNLPASFDAGFSLGLRLNVFNQMQTAALAPYVGLRRLYKRDAEFGLLAGFTLGLVL